MDLFYIIQAIVIAIVEGITEFIPVSSTGHMIIVADLINFPKNAFSVFYQIVIQAGAILAIIVMYRKKIWEIILSLFRWEARGKKFAIVIIVGSVPAIIAGVLLEEIIDTYLFNTWTVAIGLFVGAILLIIAEKYFRNKNQTMDIEQITWKQAIKIGCFQCLSLWPGMSRSSSTITGGWIMGLGSVAAAEFSFFLAIPIMLGAAGYKTFKFIIRGGVDGMVSSDYLALALGFIIAFIVALLCVRVFVSFITKNPMKYFGYYRIVLSVVLVILIVTKVISVTN